MPSTKNLAELSDVELMLVCAAAAERGGGASFCHVLGSAAQQSWLDAALDMAWSTAAGNEVADDCAELLDALTLESDTSEAGPISRIGGGITRHGDAAIRRSD